MDESLVSALAASDSVHKIFDAESTAIILDKLVTPSVSAKSGKLKTELVGSIICNDTVHTIRPLKIILDSKRQTLKIDGKFQSWLVFLLINS